MSELDDLSTTRALMRSLLAGVDADQLDGPTPCDGWSVADLMHHVVANAHFFAGAAGADPVGGVEVTAENAVARYDSAGAELASAFGAPGVLDSQVATPFGAFPGSLVLAVAVADQLTHCWDLAVATGQPADAPTDLVDRALATWTAFMGVLPEDAGMFAPAVEPGPGANDLDRLAAFAGRSR